MKKEKVVRVEMERVALNIIKQNMITVVKTIISLENKQMNVNQLLKNQIVNQ